MAQRCLVIPLFVLMVAGTGHAAGNSEDTVIIGTDDNVRHDGIEVVEEKENQRPSDQPVTEIESKGPPKPVRNTFSIGPSFMWLNYHEVISLEEMRLVQPDLRQIDGVPKSEEYGACLGVNFRFSHTFLHVPLRLSPSVTLLLGPQNTYDGSIQEYDSISHTATFTPYDTTKSNIFGSVRVMLHYLLSAGMAGFEIGAGLSGSLWLRYLGGMSEQYTRVTVPVNMITVLNFNEKSGLALDLQWLPMVWGSMKVNMPLAYRMMSNVTIDPVTLGNRLAAYRAELELRIRFNKKFGLSFGPYVESYQFGISNVVVITEKDNYGHDIIVGRYLEPSSETFNIGFSLRVMISPGADSK